jgi:hypothetical protein
MPLQMCVCVCLYIYNMRIAIGRRSCGCRVHVGFALRLALCLSVYFWSVEHVRLSLLRFDAWLPSEFREERIIIISSNSNVIEVR